MARIQVGGQAWSFLQTGLHPRPHFSATARFPRREERHRCHFLTVKELQEAEPRAKAARLLGDATNQKQRLVDRRKPSRGAARERGATQGATGWTCRPGAGFLADELGNLRQGRFEQQQEV